MLSSKQSSGNTCISESVFFSLTTESTLFRSHRVLQFTGFLKLTTAPFKQAEERKNGRRNDSMINLQEVMLPTLITRRGFELSRPAESVSV